MKTDEIRLIYLEYFKSKGHEVVQSDSLVPKDDPTLLFTGAGMNQFKEKFLGRNVTYKRAASSQKCIRTGDLDNVGRTSGHHTFFEMLGNFSFGDYFKKEAIGWAWEFLTINLKIDPARLWASVYKDDEEAYLIWRDSIKIPASRIIRFGEKENFWPSEAPTKGPNGPCGPCSEIFFDYGREVGCGKTGCTPACDCGRFVEIWNLVFTQFDRQSDGSLKPLPARNIDTGMGLERLASVLQGVNTNFDIDIFVTIKAAILALCHGGKGDLLNTAHFNAISDHIRAVTFIISDGIMPSNDDRGYIARKLIRRSLLHAKEAGIKPPFLYKLVSAVVDVMKPQYPEIVSLRDDIAQVVKREEEMFLQVIETQLPRAEEAFGLLRGSGDASKIAESAFNLYDTYGMPYDMLEEIAERFGVKIDEDEFERYLERQRDMSRSRTKIKGEIFTETFAKKVEALGLKTEFTGYDSTECPGAIVTGVMDGGEVILDKSPFYGESGGQAGDKGKIETAAGLMEVHDAKKIGEAIVHMGRMVRGKIFKGEAARLTVDASRRKRVMMNHTATHLLQAALRKVLGDHVRQTGSFVDEDRLRFDFTHINKLEDREVSRVEELVNEYITKAVPVNKSVKDLESARKEGATALFGEKYGKTVRVVTVGDISKELCGGTHADNTADINIFRIVSESSIASGVRRIEAVTGDAARRWIESEKESEARRQKLDEEKESARRDQAERLSRETERIEEYIREGKALSGVKVISRIVDGFEQDGLRILADRIKQKAGSSIVALAARTGEKASFVISLTEDLVKRGLDAGVIARKLAGSIDGSGGGKAMFAQGGGKAPAGLESALAGLVIDLEESLR